MTPFAGLGANTSGSSSLGHEIDLLATLKLNERLKFQLGYAHFFAGAYYQTTPGAQLIPVMRNSFIRRCRWNF